MKKHDEMTLKIAEIVFEKGDQLIEQNKKKKAQIRHISYAVSGICAVAIVGVSVWRLSPFIPKMNNFNNSSNIITSTENAAENDNTTNTAITETTSTETNNIHNTITSTTALTTTTFNKTTEITQTTAVATEIAETSESTNENTTSENITTQPQIIVTTEPIVTTEDSATTDKTVTKITSTTHKPVTTITTTTTLPIPITTATITTNKVEDGKFTAVIHIYDEETGEVIPGINVKFIEYDADLPTYPEPQANIVRVIEEWNTTDKNPVIIENIDFVQGHFYAVQIDEFPEGYCYSWKDHCIQGIHGGKLQGVKTYNIAVSHHKPLPVLEYPLDINREFTFSIVDKSTDEVVEGLDVELAWMTIDPEVVNNFIYVETLDTWNTSDDPVHTVNIPMHFDSENTVPYLWGIKINNMPEGYRYRLLPDYDGYYIDGGYSVGDYKYDLYSEQDVTDYIYYILPK